MSTSQFPSGVTLGSWLRGAKRIVTVRRERGQIPYKQTTALLSPLLETLRLEAVRPWGQPPAVLDVGCGRALLADSITESGIDYMGMDRDPDLLAYLRQTKTQQTFVQADVADPDFTLSRSFGTVVLAAVLEHLLDPLSVMQKLVPFLVNGGVIVATTPIRHSDSLLRVGGQLGLFSDTAHDEHEGYLNRDELITLMENVGLEVVTYQRFALGFNQLIVARRTVKGQRVTANEPTTSK